MRPRWRQNLARLICSDTSLTNALIWRTRSLNSSKGGYFLGRIWHTKINCRLHSLVSNSVSATSDDATVSASLSFRKHRWIPSLELQHWGQCLQSRPGRNESFYRQYALLYRKSRLRTDEQAANPVNKDHLAGYCL